MGEPCRSQKLGSEVEKGRGAVQYPSSFKPCVTGPRGFLGYRKKKIYG